MSDGTTPASVEEMSDEDFLNMSHDDIIAVMSDESAVEKGDDGTEAEPEVQAEANATEGDDGAEATEGEEGQGGGDATGAEGDEGDPAPKETEEKPKQAEPEGKPAEGTVPADGSEPKVETAFKAPTAEEATAFFMKVMTPIKANGKTIQLRSPEEAIQLMQQGANYTRKMQAIAPHRKVLTMLQNNDLLDEGKLDLLIGVSKKDPEAIKKFLKDSGIDPLDIDTGSEPTYVEGSHLVSDNEVTFNTVVEDIVSSEGGSETLSMIRTTWDQASKDELWKDPSLMAAIHQQKQSGVYGWIETEVNRLRTLGTIPSNMPFIQAYQVVGDHLAKSGASAPSGTSEQARQDGGKTGNPNPTPVAVRAAAPKAKVENSDRAGAAAPSRTSTKPAKVRVNVLDMPDDDFMKNLGNFQGRL